MTQRLFLILSVWFLFLPLPAQQDREAEEEEPAENVSEEENRLRRWIATLPDGRYAVKLDAIVSVSQSEYVLDGNLIVNELSIDTTGNSLARFYYIEPITSHGNSPLAQAQKKAQDLAKRTLQRTGANRIAEMAQKNYPTTTHAHTVEFRLKSKQEVTALFNSVFQAWNSGKGRNLEVTDGESSEGSDR